MKIKKYDLILGLLIIAEFILCLYIGFSAGNNYLCQIGTGCDLVQNSIYASIFGIKLAWFGAISFAILFVLFLIARFNKKLYWMFFLASVIGAAFAIYFISLQVFMLKALCRECMLIDSVMVLMLIVTVFEYLDFKKEIRKLEKTAERFASKAKF